MNRHYRILHIITGLQVGGAEMALYRLLSSQDRSQFQSEVVSLTDDQPVGGMIRELGIPVTSLGFRPGSFDPRLVTRLVGQIRHIRPQLIQTWMYHADLFGAISARLASSPPVVWGIRHTVTGKDSLKPRTYLIAKTCALFSHYLPAKIICNSKLGLSTHAALGYDKSKMLVIPNGFDTKKFAPAPQMRTDVRAELGLSPETRLVGLGARFDPLKDHSGFLKAASLLSQKRQDVHFVLWGKSVDTQNQILTAILDEFGIKAYVHLLGLRLDAARLFASLDVASLSSLSEAFPQVLGEAMACGVPCVSTDVGDAAFIIGDTGRIVPPREPQLLANAWNELLSLSEPERIALGETARERIGSLFSLVKTTQKYEQTYQDIIAGGERA
jgi:glycosyltransferase involved in cell wall biosynthesis